jgi:deoxyribonuclease V
VWPPDEAGLAAEQRRLAALAPAPWRPRRPEALAVAACAVCFPKGPSPQGAAGAAGDPAWAAAVVLRDRRALAEAVVATRAGAAYAPGLLALREGPALEAAVRALPVAPDVLLVDATGRDHPRRAGLALQLGAVLDLPSIGVTHRPLLAAGPWPATDERGARAPLLLGGEVVGAWLRTRARARPVAVHPGWRTSVEVALEVVLRAGAGRRTPEPLRQAHRLAREARAGAQRA